MLTRLFVTIFVSLVTFNALASEDVDVQVERFIYTYTAHSVELSETSTVVKDPESSRITILNPEVKIGEKIIPVSASWPSPLGLCKVLKKETTDGYSKAENEDPVESIKFGAKGEVIDYHVHQRASFISCK